MSDAAWMQSEIDVQIARGMPPVLRLDARTYLVERPVSFRQWRVGAGIIGVSGTHVECRFPPELRNMLMFEAIGCTRFHAADVEFMGGPPTNPQNLYEPAAILLFARNTAGHSAGHHVVERCRFYGRSRLAHVANIASEVNTFRDCEFDNHEGPSKTVNGLPYGGHNVYVANHDDGWFGLPMGRQTMQDLLFDRCHFSKTPVAPEDANGVSVMVQAAENTIVSDLTFNNCGGGSFDQFATYAIDMQGAGGQVHGIDIIDGRREDDTTKHLLKVACKLPRSIEFVEVRGVTFLTSDQPIDLGEYASNIEVTNNRVTKIGTPSNERFVKSGSLVKSRVESNRVFGAKE